jgi:uncharacterized membrane protein YcaP (DUF421 family)
MFSLGLSVGEKVIRAALLYFFMIAALRVFGKREIGQQNTLDILVLLLVANAVQNGIIGNDNSVTGALIGALALFAIDGLCSWLAFRYAWAERLLEGSPTWLMRRHKVDERALRRAQISVADLRAQARRQGFANLDDVGEVVLETNGTISMLREDERPIVPPDSEARRPSQRSQARRRAAG